MLIELSMLTTSRRSWEPVDKQPPIYSISDGELKKARVQYSIGIVEPRVNVTKLRIKMGEKASIETRIALNKNKLMRLYKDDQGFYLKEVDW